MKRAGRILRRVFPPARRPVGGTAVLSLLLFAASFALVSFSVIRVPRVFLTEDTWVFGLPRPQVEFLGRLQFDDPWMFLLLVFVPWIWWMQAAGHAGLTVRRAAVAGFVRLWVAGLLIVVLAGPRSVRTSDVLSVMYTVDVSDSVSEARQEALEVVAATAAEKPSADQAGLVIFGRSAAVELPPRSSFPFEKFLNAQVGRDATNLEQSLSLSAAMLPEEHRGRIVLFSDGAETIGRMNDVVDDLQARQIRVDVVPIDYEYDHEVLLERLDLPRYVRLGETYEASVVLTSLSAGSGFLVLEQNEEELARVPVEFSAGRSRFSLPIQVQSPGYYEYTARIEVPAGRDSRVENNEARNYLFIDGPGRILLVTDPEGDPEEWRYFEQALRQGERQVEVISALEFPLDTLALMPYDCIVFADVPANALLTSQIQAVHDAVRDLGVGFLMLGGPNSFGPGGYENSPIEDCLPISMQIGKKKILPKGALVIILHTCEFPRGNSWARKITKKAIQVLNAEDEVGAIGFGSEGDYWIFELTPAGEYLSLVKQINAAEIGDMPSFSSSMKMGMEALTKSNAASRHMIIISDGDAQPPPPQDLQAFVDAQITVSTVAVFPHNGPQGTRILQSIASVTGGRFYYPSNPRQLPSIFVKEARTLRRSQVQVRSFTPTLRIDDPVVRGLDALPELHGYVLTSEKDDPRASVILSAPPAEDDPVAAESDVDPILAVWRYGLGASAAFTSDMTTGWGRDWVSWDRFQQMVTQLITRIGRVRREQHLRVYTYTNGNEGVIVVEDFHPEEMLLDVTADVTGPNGFARSVAVRQTAPRRYQVRLPLQGRGRYQVQVRAAGTDRNETAYAGFIVSYSPEHLRFRANPIVLREVAERTGGREIDVDQDAEELTQQIFGERKPRTSQSRVFDWFLMMLACLVPLDVAVRRVQIDAAWITQLFRRQQPEEEGSTVGALLEKSQAVRSALASRSDRVAADPTGSRSRTVQRADWSAAPSGSVGSRPSEPSAAAAPSGADPAADPAADGGESEEGGSTTSRLLAIKRRREQERKNRRDF